MKKLVVLLVLLVLGGGGAYYYYFYGKPEEKPQVITAAISQGDIIEGVKATGTLEPWKRVDVGSQVSGTVKAMHVDFNSIVRQRQLLAELDPSLLQVQVEIQKANVARQEGEIANQEVQLEDTKKQLERTDSLFKRQLVNQQQLEAAQLAVKTRVAQIDSLKKQLIQAKANLSLAELNVSYTKIYSPIDGVVVDRKVDVGQTVQASMTTPSFFVLATDLSRLKLTALVDESEISKLRTGMSVEFMVDAFGQRKFRGQVDAVRLNATNQNNVITYPVWIDVPNPNYELRPSMTANVTIIVSTAPNVVRVPNTALRFRPNTEIYTALGLEPPAPGRGRPFGAPETDNNSGRTPSDRAQAGRGQGGATTDGRGGRGQTAGAAPSGQTSGQPVAQPRANDGQSRAGQARGDRMASSGSERAGQGDRPSGRGGFGGGLSNLTPEQRRALMERFGRGGGGRGGEGRNRSEPGGGRGQGGGDRSGPGSERTSRQQTSQNQAQRPSGATKIDEMFVEVERRVSPASVWTWDEAKKELKQINIRIGITDGTFSELVSGDVQVGQQVVTAVVIPNQQRQQQPGQNIFMQPQRGPGGLQPGFPGGGGGGDRGGRGGGGGGGGRGGN